MKNFRDSTGMEWTVFEVRRAVSAKGDWSYLPSGFSDGWLCFECGEEKRRLAPVPEGWDRADDETIEQWCCSAKPVVRRKNDHEHPADGPRKMR